MFKLLILAVAFAGFSAFADYTTDMTCAQVQAQVATGYTVLSSCPGHSDGYVSSPDYCGLGQTGTRAWVPTSDVAHCDAGYTCAPGPVDTGS